MKIRVRHFVRDERGAALALTIVLLLVGGLIIAPVMAHMGTGIKAGEVHERLMDETYAADAGIEYALWTMVAEEDVPNLTKCEEIGFSYVAPPFELNGRIVRVQAQFVRRHPDDTQRGIFKITSEVFPLDVDFESDPPPTPLTTIVSHVEAREGAPLDFSGILDHVITSRCDYVLQGGQMSVSPGEGEENGPVKNYPGAWPTAEQLSNWYFSDVDGHDYDGDNLIDLAGSDMERGPLFIDNAEDLLQILNSVNPKNGDPTLTLTNTLYITGDTDIGQTSHEFTLNLNGHAIFVESATGAAPEDEPCNPGNQYALRIGDKVTITGSGVIIAVGNIELKPNFQGSDNDYLLVMSVSGKTYMQPSGQFYGTLAGTSEVYLQNATATWTDPSGRPLNFPIGDEEDDDWADWDHWSVTSYIINPGSD